MLFTTAKTAVNSPAPNIQSTLLSANMRTADNILLKDIITPYLAIPTNSSLRGNENPMQKSPLSAARYINPRMQAAAVAVTLAHAAPAIPKSHTNRNM